MGRRRSVHLDKFHVIWNKVGVRVSCLHGGGMDVVVEVVIPPL